MLVVVRASCVIAYDVVSAFPSDLLTLAAISLGGPYLTFLMVTGHPVVLDAFSIIAAAG